MSRSSKKLSALEINRIAKVGKHPLGENLYLQVSQTGSKSWLFRYSIHGKTTWMGLGSTKYISLADARSTIAGFQRDLANGQNPLLKKINMENDQKLAAARKTTFSECATLFIEAHAPSWKNKKHRSQWSNTLDEYVNPVIGSLAVESIDTNLVLSILEPLWYRKPETASRIRGRIERILSWAAARGYRSSENPARWRGHLDQLLPKRSAISSIRHFEALPFGELNDFIEKLRQNESVANLALEFLILTATRTNETLGSRWSEINFDEKYWLIPADRMKVKKDHKVPLSNRALNILLTMKNYSDSEYIFPGSKAGRPLSNMSLLMIIRRMNYRVTTHGFRSTFSDWASEKTNFPRDVIEMALAHTIKNKAEAAYRRGNLFLKRQLLMQEWGKYCSTRQELKGEVIEFEAYLRENQL